MGILRVPDDEHRELSLVIAAVVIGLVIHAIMYAPQPAIMAEMFPTRMRYSGVSLGYQVTSIVAGSLAPIITVSVSSVPGCRSRCTSPRPPWSPSSRCFMRETNGIALESLDVADREELAKAGVV